ncbi:uncharacterized protein LOC106080690 [Stomoxys calcitrans]|uniref:uncharacterized protein LOC106080690 n=1 Tax=Stomoxys calcitrans TaxID=35570 RepID=UPI0027E28757|nr:uncharacterized protein LOC106080690 [Stomoxys calcitrans]
MYPLTASYYDAKQKVWSGPQCKDLYSPNITLGEVICDALAKNPQKIIQIDDATGEKLRCNQLLHYAKALARNLLNLGLKPNDVISLYANNWTHVATLMLACLLCGTPVNSLFPGFDRDTLALIYNLTKPKIIFCELENCKIAQEVNSQLNLNAQIFVLNGNGVVPDGVSHIRDLLEFENVDKGDCYRFPCHELHGDDTALILCSSGTTGTPKGVLCSHRALLNEHVLLTLKADSVIFGFSTLYWASGVFGLMACLINACLRIITSQPFTCDYFLDLAQRYRITHFLVGTNQMAQLSMYEDVAKMQKCFESVDTMLVGGSKIPLAVQEKTRSILSCNAQRPGFAIAYGMSEIVDLVSCNIGYVSEYRQGSEGKLVGNKKVRIINKESQPVGPLEHGEICVLNPYPWRGYLNNEKATSKALVDNWLHTGDVGFFDADGFLHICSRNIEVFKSNNFQIYPSLIEDVIYRIPGIAEVCVFGIPDIVASNLTACAVVRLANGVGSTLTAEHIDHHVQNCMSSVYHLNGGVYFVDKIPKTGSGKMQRSKVLEIVMQMKERK